MIRVEHVREVFGLPVEDGVAFVVQFDSDDEYGVSPAYKERVREITEWCRERYGPPEHISRQRTKDFRWGGMAASILHGDRAIPAFFCVCDADAFEFKMRWC